MVLQKMATKEVKAQKILRENNQFLKIGKYNKGDSCLISVNINKANEIPDINKPKRVTGCRKFMD